MFFRLGVLNVRRQLTRSFLVILTLALAAISLTYSLSYQQITPPRASQWLGNFVGGEILVAPLRWAGQQVTDVTDQVEYEYARLTASGLSWLQWFYPELYSDGFWAERERVPTEFFRQDDLARLAEFPGVASVSTTQFLPAMLEMQDDHGSFLTPLLITPQSERLGQYACVDYPGDFSLPPPGRGIMLNNAAQLPDTVHLFEPGASVRLWLPQATGSSFSRTAPAELNLPFQRYLQLPTRTVAWDPKEDGETGRFNAPLAWVDSESWAELLRSASAANQLPVANVALRLQDPQQLDGLLARLGQAFPHLTFADSGDVEERLFRTGKMELFLRAPRSSYSSAERVSLVVPASFSRTFGLLSLLIAACLLGGQMLTNTAARQQEIGTLRALGARRRDILLLGLSEAATTAVIGVTAGFLVLRLYGAMMELRGGIALFSVLSLMLREYGQVLGIALGSSLCFAIFPIWRLTALSPMEVLRNE